MDKYLLMAVAYDFAGRNTDHEGIGGAAYIEVDTVAGFAVLLHDVDVCIRDLIGGYTGIFQSDAHSFFLGDNVRIVSAASQNTKQHYAAKQKSKNTFFHKKTSVAFSLL